MRLINKKGDSISNKIRKLSYLTVFSIFFIFIYFVCNFSIFIVESQFE